MSVPIYKQQTEVNHYKHVEIIYNYLIFKQFSFSYYANNYNKNRVKIKTFLQLISELSRGYQSLTPVSETHMFFRLVRT